MSSIAVLFSRLQILLPNLQQKHIVVNGNGQNRHPVHAKILWNCLSLFLYTFYMTVHAKPVELPSPIISYTFYIIVTNVLHVRV